MRVSGDVNVVMIAGVALQVRELGDAGEVVSDLGRSGRARLIKLVGREAIFDDEFSFIGRAAPDENGIGSWLAEHWPVREADGIAVGFLSG